MREFVRIGAPEEIVAFREKWMAKAPVLAAELGLPQRQQALKFELLIPYYPSASPTACMSFNYHREHFGQVWGIHTNGGELAHTSCVAFGIDRLAVALFANHGLDLKKWPAATRQALAL
jgi:seryl-tRNA synthetase